MTHLQLRKSTFCIIDLTSQFSEDTKSTRSLQEKNTNFRRKQPLEPHSIRIIRTFSQDLQTQLVMRKTRAHLPLSLGSLQTRRCVMLAIVESTKNYTHRVDQDQLGFGLRREWPRYTYCHIPVLLLDVTLYGNYDLHFSLRQMSGCCWTRYCSFWLIGQTDVNQELFQQFPLKVSSCHSGTSK